MMDPTPLIPKESETKKIKRHRLRKTLITLGVIVVLLLVGVSATGLYSVPGVSSALGTNKPKDLGVHPTAADWTAVSSKTPLKVIGEPSVFSVFGKKKYSGTTPVDNQLTSAELTAWVQHYTRTDGDVRNVQVRFHEGGMEISAFAKRYVNAPIYVDVDVTRTGTTSATLNVTKGKIGMFTVPSKYLKMFNDYAQDVLNDHLADIPGFSMDNLEYHDGYRVFKGTYPATVEAGTGKWW